MCIQHMCTGTHAHFHIHTSMHTVTKQEVFKPLKVAALGAKFMVRTQERANKRVSVGCFMNTNFDTISQNATT